MNEIETNIRPAPRPRNGPHPGVLVLVSLLLTILALVLGPILLHGDGYPSPFSAERVVVGYFRIDPTAIRVLAMIQFGSAVPLAIASAAFYAGQLRVGIRVPGPVIGLSGGLVASAMLMLSGLVTWTLGRPEVSGDPGIVRTGAFAAFATGGFGFVVGLGLLVAGLAVPALILRLLPLWLAWAGLVIAALSELSFLAMALDGLQFLLPLGRFGGLLWLVAAGFALPVRRPRRVRGQDAGQGAERDSTGTAPRDAGRNAGAAAESEEEGRS